MPGKLGRAAVRVYALVLVSSHLSGCLVLQAPYPVEAETTVVQDATMAGYLTVGPRRLIEDMTRRIERYGDRIESVDPVAFRDIAFPEGGWSIAAFLDDERCRTVRDSSGVRFLVLLLVGPPRSSQDDKSVPFGLGAAGYEIEESSLSALLFDFDDGEIVCRIDSNAAGKELFFVTWAGGYATNAITEPSVKDALAQAIAARLQQEAVSGPVMIAVLAAERPVGYEAEVDPSIP